MTRTHAAIGWLAGTVLGLLNGTVGMADPVQCPGAGFSVSNADVELSAELCEIAEAAATELAECNLPQTRPVAIEVVEDIAHPFGLCLAAFDCEFDRIRLVQRDDYSTLVEPGDPYGELPRDVLIGTLLTHEITHALVTQNAGAREVPLVDHEFIAAALEMEALPPEWRGAILDYAMLDAPSLSRINIWIYRMAPRRFAANAWLHFSAPGNGCELIGRLVSGQNSFAELPP